MASSVVKEWQPLSVLKMLIVQTMHSRSFGGKMKNILLFTMVWRGWLLVLYSCTSQEVLPLHRCDAD
jgi:hypothetical protein